MFKHLKENNISYFKHMKRALYISFLSFISFLLSFIHAFFPFIFTNSARKINFYMNKKIFKRDRK